MKGIFRNIISATFAIGLLAAPAYADSSEKSVGKAKVAAESNQAQQGPINLNKASVEELSEMKGVGVAKAQAIVAYRKEKGGFKSIDELTQIKGIGPSILESNRPLLSLE